MGEIVTARVYDRDRLPEGRRFLVERLWPRGVRSSELSDVEWVREVAPSTELRRWFGHDRQRWTEFRRRYTAELDAAPDAWAPLAAAAADGRLVLLYSARDVTHNSALVLADYLEQRQ